MGSTETRRMELGRELRELAELSAPGVPEPRLAAAESFRRRRSSRFLGLCLAAGAALCVGMPLAQRGLGPRPWLAGAFASGAASEAAAEFAAAVLGPRAPGPAGLDAEIETYLVALWDSD